MAPLAVIACGDDSSNIGGAGGTSGTSTHAATSSHTTGTATATGTTVTTTATGTATATGTTTTATNSSASTGGGGGEGGAGTTTSTTTTTTTTTTTSSTATSSTASTATASTSTGLMTENCNNGNVDDDGDGDADCADTDCLSDPSCTAPATWTCDPTFYHADDGCDCGCGIQDPDCADLLVASCTYCDEGCGVTDCPGTIDPTNNAICVPPVPEICDDGVDNDGDFDTDCFDSECVGTPECTPPAGWNCNDAFYFDTDCDCGCGIFDPACADATDASCDFCGDTGSCSDFSCADIDPANNAVCLP